MNPSSLKTLKDFDFGIDTSKATVRVTNVVEDQVSESEVNLILWILLEQRHSDNFDDSSDCHDSAEDQVDSKRSRIFSNQWGGGLGIKQPSQNAQATQYTENLLRCVGVNVPFKLLSSSEKKRLFQQFCESSNLLLSEKYSSILDLYEALRRRSKFKEQFSVQKLLGEGKYGKVYDVQLKNDSSEQVNRDQDHFAIKKIDLSFDSLEDVKMILNESAILKKLRGNARIVTFHNSWLAMEFDQDDSDSRRFCDDSLVFYLQMELCGITLSDWKLRLKTEKPTEEKCLVIAEQLAEGLVWIHSNGILHLDINPRNIFWSDSNMNNIKVGDFGLGVQTNSCLGRRGTAAYCGPEYHMTSKSDMYSAGVTLFEMAQIFPTRSELITRLERRDFFTGMKTLDLILQNLLLLEPSKRWEASRLKSFIQERNS